MKFDGMLPERESLIRSRTSRYLVPTHEFPPFRGGAGNYLSSLVNAGSSLGNRVDVWVPKASTAKGEGSLTIRPILGKNQNIYNLWKTRAFFRHRPVNWKSTCLIIGEAAVLKAWLGMRPERRPRVGNLIFLFHGSELGEWTSERSKTQRLMEALLDAGRVGVVSGYVEEMFRKAFPAFCAPVVQVPGFLPNGFRYPSTDKAAESKSVYQVLTVGRVHPRKGQRVTIEAIGRLPERLKQRVVYKIAGDIRRKAYFRKLKARARELGVQLDYLGVPGDMELAGHYQDADLFVLASGQSGHSVEGLGLVLLEAAAHGLPRIVTDHGGMSELVQDGVDGYVVPTLDIDALSKSMESLLQNDALRRSMALDSRKLLESRPKWPELWSRLVGH